MLKGKERGTAAGKDEAHKEVKETKMEKGLSSVRALFLLLSQFRSHFPQAKKAKEAKGDELDDLISGFLKKYDVKENVSNVSCSKDGMAYT